MAPREDILPAKAPAYLKLSEPAAKEWERVVKSLAGKAGLSNANDRVILEYYAVNYQLFLDSKAARDKYLVLEARNEAILNPQSEDERAELKFIRQSRQQAEDAVNKAMARGLMLSQKLYLNPNDRRKGKVSSGSEGKSAFDSFLVD